MSEWDATWWNTWFLAAGDHHGLCGDPHPSSAASVAKSSKTPAPWRHLAFDQLTTHCSRHAVFCDNPFFKSFFFWFFSFCFSFEKAWSCIILKVFECSDVFMIPSCILLPWQDRPRKSSQSSVWKKPKTSMLRAMQLCRNENNWWLQFWHLQRHIFDMNRILWIHFCFFGASWAWHGLTLVDVRMLFLTKFSFEARFSRFCVRLKLFLFLFFFLCHRACLGRAQRNLNA